MAEAVAPRGPDLRILRKSADIEGGAENGVALEGENKLSRERLPVVIAGEHSRSVHALWILRRLRISRDPTELDASA